MNNDSEIKFMGIAVAIIFLIGVVVLLQSQVRDLKQSVDALNLIHQVTK